MLGWSQSELAERSKVARATLAEFESGRRTPYDRTLDDIQRALEAAGAIFTETGVELAPEPDEGPAPGMGM